MKGNGEEMKKDVDWRKIRNEYITTDISQRKLAKKYDVPYNTLQCRARREEWTKQKNEAQCRIESKSRQKIEEKIVEKEVDRITRILNLSDMLADRVEQAIGELDIYLAKSKERTKIVTRDQNTETEVVEEKENIIEIHSRVDRQGLLQVANTLKTIKDINIDITKDTEEEYESDGLLEALAASADELMEDDSSMLPIEED